MVAPRKARKVADLQLAKDCSAYHAKHAQLRLVLAKVLRGMKHRAHQESPLITLGGYTVDAWSMTDRLHDASQFHSFTESALTGLHDAS